MYTYIILHNLGRYGKRDHEHSTKIHRRIEYAMFTTSSTMLFN